MRRMLIAVVALVAVSTYADNWGFYDLDRSWIGISQTNSSSTNWFSLWNGAAGTFEGAFLGSYSNTMTLQIDAYDTKTWKSAGGDVTGVEYFYRVYATNAAPGSFITLGGGFMQDLGGGNQKWGNPSLNTNLLNGTTAGNTYYVEVYGLITGSGTPASPIHDNSGGANYKATFVVIPEPSAFLLVASALLGTVLLRRRNA
jgi:hypothetical protein